MGKRNYNIKHLFFLLKNEDILGRLVTFIALLFCTCKRFSGCVESYNRNIWLIGENRGECVKDNGYYFYEYCRKRYPDKNVFFVIKKISPFYKFMESDNNIVIYGSSRHAVLFFRSTICCYTHTYRDLIYKKYFELFGKDKKLIYLHHGVLGFKKFNNFYFEKRNIMDYFIVGSQLEKDILINQIGVVKEKIKFTGYARFDYLKDKSDLLPIKQIIFMPTHRNWIQGNIKDTVFYERINSFINNKRLYSLLEKNNINFKVYLHKQMQIYSEILNNLNLSHINIVQLGQETPLQLISESSLMITDYSSVSWDFFYLGKPVVFYRFDLEDYERDRQSYIPLDKEIIGDVMFNEEELLQVIESYITNGFNLKEQFKDYRNEILPHLDNNNCNRIFDQVKQLSLQLSND